MDTWGCEKSESSSTRFAARPDDHETMALRAAVWAEAARRPANWRPRSPGEGPSRPVSEPLALRPGFAAAGSPPSPPATSTSAAIMSGRVQGHLTFGKSKDKAWAPRPSLRQPLAPQPSRRRPPEAPDILEVTEFTLHSPAKSRGPPARHALPSHKGLTVHIPDGGGRNSGFSTLTKYCGLFARSLGNSSSLFSKDAHLAAHHL